MHFYLPVDMNRLTACIAAKLTTNNNKYVQESEVYSSTFTELSAEELIRTGSFAKKWSDTIELSCASRMTDWSFFFSRFHMHITPDEPPEARRG